ncbi:MAG: hypothetical protein M5U28_24485 [Sandaracinaceae bacterium]|nr:hypothetical protein [Sandaracinaceae bacterium]
MSPASGRTSWRAGTASAPCRARTGWSRTTTTPDPKAPDKIYVDRGGFLDPIAFDPMRWGVPPSILPATDSTQLLALVVAERALRDAFGDAMEGSIATA